MPCGWSLSLICCYIVGAAKTGNRRASRTRSKTRTDEDWGEQLRWARARASGGPLLTIVVVVRIPSRGGAQSIVSLHRLSRNIDNGRRRRRRRRRWRWLFYRAERTVSAMCAWLLIIFGGRCYYCRLSPLSAPTTPPPQPPLQRISIVVACLCGVCGVRLCVHNKRRAGDVSAVLRWRLGVGI